MAANRRIVLTGRPEGGRVTEDLFRLEESARPEPKEGEALVRNLLLSLEPAMRGWISDVPNYSPPVPVGDVMRSFAVGEVVESRHPTLKVGQKLYGRFGWQEWATTDGKTVHRIHAEDDLPPSYSAHLLGLTGFTAYQALLSIGQPKAGETVVVSTAAGAVGSVVGQIARLKGCHTVGITGSEAKVRDCLESFGYDAAINYKKEDVAAALRAACPDGVDVYFDNTAGPVSDAVMQQLRTFARIIVCGTMAIPSAPPPTGPRYNRAILVARARMEGFMVFDHIAGLEDAAKELAGWAREGRIKVKEDWAEGLEATVPHFLRLLAGDNSGKALVRLTDR